VIDRIKVGVDLWVHGGFDNPKVIVIGWTTNLKNLGILDIGPVGPIAKWVPLRDGPGDYWIQFMCLAATDQTRPNVIRDALLVLQTIAHRIPSHVSTMWMQTHATWPKGLSFKPHKTAIGIWYLKFDELAQYREGDIGKERITEGNTTSIPHSTGVALSKALWSFRMPL
jgi:hypothetical protein